MQSVNKVNEDSPPKTIMPSTATNPKISVCVITYNHAEYILECLEGIRNQIGAPTFEVIIRDDASTDDTEQIVRSYIQRYRLSNFFYYRIEKNGGMMKNFTEALGMCSGEFVAICEGDDYWTDPSKLQKQYALMSIYPNCMISVHASYIDAGIGPVRKAFQRSDTIKRFDLSDVLAESSTQFAPTASYMLRQEVVLDLPEWFEEAPIGDTFLELLSLKKGYGLFMPDVMSAYRVFATGSWSSGMKNDCRRAIEYGQRMLKLIAVLESDPQLKANGIDILKGNLKALLASEYLLCNEFKNFRDCIEESFAINSRFQSRTATYLYKLRRFPTLASLIYRIKRSCL